MSWKHIFAKKDLEMLLAEMAGEHRLHRVLGPVALTALGVGCIVGAGIFVLTGVAAADFAGPSIIISFAIAGLGCAMAALCYAEFAAMAPVAGSVYTYAYTTLGEIFAWIIGWDIILEYSMGCAAVASLWGNYLNELLGAMGLWTIPKPLCTNPFSHIEGSTAPAILNLPAVFIMGLVTLILVLGIRESARTNALLVFIKIFVVFFVILAGIAYVKTANWNSIPVTRRILPQERVMLGLIKEQINQDYKGKNISRAELDRHAQQMQKQLEASYRMEWANAEMERLQKAGRISAEQAKNVLTETKKEYGADLPVAVADREAVEKLLPKVREVGEQKETSNWGILGYLGLNRWLLPLDDASRSSFAPYGFSGIMLGASIVFFAFIGFDSISTHAEEARNPQRDVPIGIIVSLVLCTFLYIAVAAVITGMVPYPQIDIHAPIAAAFTERAVAEKSMVLRISGGLIAAGGLAGMTSVLLVLFLSQARVFMAMSRDGLLPKVFGTIHSRFRTPHVATLTTGVIICIVAALTPILKLAEMVNIGTLMAFAMVCAAVMILRVQRPHVHRPFRCPALFFIGTIGIMVNLTLMLFLPLDTWLRLVIWLAIGMVIYFTYSRRHSLLTQYLLHEIQTPRSDEDEGSVQAAGE
ncbi:MAG: amino acid permease [Thermoguttaceae bacterium]|jgi:APA family basic amino acid/polyamine antiporter